MKFRTELHPEVSPIQITHADSIMLLGSCFASEVGKRLQSDGFDAVVNPVGTLYNPLSIARIIRLMEANKRYDSSEIFENQGLWRSFDHHSSLSDADCGVALDKINGAMEMGGNRLRQADLMIVTFGTAWVYELPDGRVVCNCHKLPSSCFLRRRLGVDEIVDVWSEIIRSYPDKRFIFTVSPIRHTADGLHGNQLSKATLLLAIDRLASIHPEIEYFPAYEALVDDLRDYRFYAPDMKHPSEVAADYVYQLFADSHFSALTAAKSVECRKASRSAAHRPLH